ncbi:MAG TPA: DUF6748 domain-containing protein [Pyrinomonadaceae bacterium]|nr:DUF6748 domain-containing protein [Pyrinomonadaceae bacterium]
MLNFKYIRAALVAAAIAALTWSSGASPKLVKGKLEKPNIVNAGVSESVSVSPEPIDATSTFYSLRRDLRRCVSPLCGGYFVKRVNMSSTRCANGRFMNECYVAEIDWHGQPETDIAHLLVRGSIVARRYGQFGSLGELRVSESWMTISDNQPVGTYYLVRDRGVRCITFPCPTHHEAKLNSSFSRNIAGVKLDSAGLGENNAAVANTAMTGPDGLIVTGSNVVVTGPGGRSFELRGTQAYVRNKTNGNSMTPDTGSMKPCIKTGCSSQVCSDHNVITTCEFRPEYACYQKAACERQRDGNCGFTKTPELTACLARK